MIDTDLIEAREIVKASLSRGNHDRCSCRSDIDAGKWDGGPRLTAVLAGIKRGRSLRVREPGASPGVAAEFTRWMLDELAAHDSAPCPDEEMNRLVNVSAASFRALALKPALTCDDLVLKLFPVILAEYEAKLGEHPLIPEFESGFGATDAEGFAVILEDLRRLSPEIAQAMASPFKREEATHA